MAVETRFFEGTPEELSNKASPATPSVRYAAGTNPSTSSLTTPFSASTASLSPNGSTSTLPANRNRSASSVTASSSVTSISGATVSQKRQDEFEKYFADKLNAEYSVDDVDLTVLATQSADYQGKVLIHGRLYLTASHLCFRSNILGFRTERIHRLKNVKSVKKGTTAKWIKNAIYVCVDDGSASRERSGSTSVSPSTPAKQSPAATATSVAGVDNGANGTSGTNGTKEVKETSGTGDIANGVASYGSLGDREAMYESVVNCWRIEAPERYNDMMEHLAEDPTVTEEEDVSAGTGLEATTEEDDDDSSEKAAKALPTDADAPASHGPPDSQQKVKHTECTGEHLKELALDAKIPLTPEKLYQLIYQTPEFTQEFYEKDQKLTDVKISDWQDEEGGVKKRELNSVMHMNIPIGPSKSASIGVERVLQADPETAYEIMSESRTPDVPSGKSFVIHTRTCLTHDDIKGRPATRIYCTTQCDWIASSWLKGKIGPAVIKGQKEYHQQLMVKIRQWIKDHPDEFGKPKAVRHDGKEVAANEDVPVVHRKGHSHHSQGAKGPEGADESAGVDEDEDQVDDDDDGFEIAGDETTKTDGKSWLDHASEIGENPVMLAITALCALLLAMTLYRSLYAAPATCPDPGPHLAIPESRLESLEHRLERIAKHVMGDHHLDGKRH